MNAYRIGGETGKVVLANNCPVYSFSHIPDPAFASVV